MNLIKNFALSTMILAPMTAGAENMFNSLLGKSEDETAAKIESVWRHFFTPGDIALYENPGQKSVYYLDGDDTGFIMDTGSNDVRTEGMSYGMMTVSYTGHGFTDPSCMLPAFLDRWAEIAGEERDFWAGAATAARNHLVESAHPVTGLHPDYSNYDGSAYRWPHAGYDTSTYMYDAIRCAMNIGMDSYLTGKDTERQRDVMRRMLRFFKNDGFTHAHFAIDGTNPSGGYSRGMDGSNAVGAIALAHSDVPGDRELATEFVQRLWDAEPPTGKYRYYEGMVYFLSLLHVSGNFSLDFN